MIQQITVEHVTFVSDRPFDAVIRAICEHPDGKTRLVFNTPSRLMSGLDNAAVQSAALKLDAKMMALGEAVTGAKA
jgi:hypothetical protein